MHNFEAETYHVWRPDLLAVAGLAVNQKSSVVIQCHMYLDKCNTADVTLKGRFLDITGHQAQFIVDNFDLELSRNFPIWPECEYTFVVDQPLSSGPGNRVEYGGRAIIQDFELHRNNLPIGLLLRLTTPTRIRQLRKHKRHSTPQKVIAMPGLMLIDQAPTSRRRLLMLLAQYYHQKNRPRPELIDISAGGVCVQTEDTHCQRFMGAEESYLFFFFPANQGNPKCPFVFVGKKVGIFRTDESRHAGLRIKFLRELLWDQPEDELKWVDIGPEGSITLEKMISEWNKANPPILREE